MLSVDMPIIVEGKYDKIKLSSFIDGIIIETNGFRIFSDKKKLAFIKRLAETKGIIILTDSDAAGFKIRNIIRSACANGKVVNAYIPDIYGKEKRKDKFSKEGKLGVEGVPEEVIIEALKKAGAVFSPCRKEEKREITVYDLYEDSLTGRDNSSERKKKLLAELELPEHISNSQLLKLMNTFMTYDEYKIEVKKISDC